MGGASGAVAGGGASALGKASSGTATGDALIWLILGVVVLIAGAVYVFIKSRRLATNAGTHADINTSSKKKTIIVAIVTALIACTCFGMFASKGVAFAKEYLEGITGDSNVVVDNQGNVISNDLAINNNSGEAIFINNVQAPDELKDWNASIKDETILPGSSAKGKWDGKTIPASLLEQVESNSSLSIELSLKVSVSEVKNPLDFDKFEVAVTPVEYTGTQIKPEVTVSGDYKEGIDYEVIYGENTNAGEGTVTIKGIGDYKGEKTYTFTIEPASIDSDAIVISEEGTTYTGSQLKPTVTIEGLVEGTDFEVTYGDNKTAGTGAGSVTVTGKGNYTGTLTKNFDIQPASIESKTITISTEGTTYTGGQLKPTVAIEGLTQGTDFTVSYGENKTAGTGTGSVIVTGKGNYSGSQTKTFDIQPASIESKTVTISTEGTTYTGGQLKPTIIIDGLTQGTDFDVTYGENKTAGKDKGSVTVTGKGNYTGSQSKTFDIQAASIDPDKIVISTEGTTYTGGQLKPTVTIEGLTQGTDFDVTYGENKAVGKDKGSVTVTGKGNYTGSQTKTFDIQAASIDPEKIVISSEGTTYTGEQLTPAVTIEGLTQGTDFTVSYGDNKTAGTGAGSVTVTGKGNYAGSQTKTFDIARATPTVVKPTGVTAEVGQTLAEVSIPAQVAPNVPGTFAWEGDTSQSVGKAGDTPTFKATFTPNDTTNYETVTGIEITLTVTEKTVKKAFAVYSEEGEGVNSLTFYTDTDANIEKAKTDKTYSNKPVTAVYTGIEDSSYTRENLPEWINNYRTSITKVEVANKIKPISTAFWFENCENLLSVDGLSNVDTSRTATMRAMFLGCNKLTALSGMSGWNTSEVIDMNSLFYNCQKLVTVDDVSNWDTGNVTAMGWVFGNCYALKGSSDSKNFDLSGWKTSKVTDMEYMFDQCCALTSLGDISKWKTGNVENMTNMFRKCSVLGANCSNWDVTKVKDSDFFNSDAPGVLSPWGPATAYAVYSDDGSLNFYKRVQVPSAGDTFDEHTVVAVYTAANGTDIENDVYTDPFSGDIPQWSKDHANDIKSVTVVDTGITPDATSYWFNWCQNLTSIDVSNLDTSNVKTMQAWFAGCKMTNINLTGLNLSNVENTSYMFYCSDALESIDGIADWQTGNIQNMDNMFNGCSSLTADCSKWDVKKSPSHSGFSTGAKAVTEPDWDAKTVYTFAVYSADDNSLTFYKDTTVPSGTYKEKTVTAVWDGIETATYSSESLPGWNEYASSIKTVEFKTEVSPISTAYWFANCYQLTTLDLSKLNTSNVTDMSFMFACLEGTPKLTSLNLSGFDTSKVTNVAGMFYGCASLTSIEGLTNATWKTGNVENMGYLFYGCTSLSSLDLSTWDVSKTKGFFCMFGRCQYLKAIDGLSKWKTAPIENMQSMFQGCASLTSLDLSGFDTSKVEDMSLVFQECGSLKSITGSKNLKMSTVTNMNGMFMDCASLETLDVTDWDVSKVEDMKFVFQRCLSLASITGISGWDVSSATETRGMFDNCSSLTSLDLSSWATKTTKVQNMQEMFNKCSLLSTVGDITKWDTKAVTNMSYMFNECGKLTADCSGWTVDAVANHTNFNTNASGVKSPWDPKAFAVYSEEGSGVNSLSFYKDIKDNIPTAGEGSSYRDKPVTAVYTDIENMSAVGPTGWMKDGNYKSITKVEVVDEGIQPTSTNFWFGWCDQLSDIDVSKLDTSKVTNMSSMFGSAGSSAGKKITLDLSSWDVSNVTDMSNMFQDCTTLVSVKGLSKWNTGKVESMSNMFNACSSLTELDVSTWDVYSVTDMRSLFFDCESLTSVGDLSEWKTKTSNVKDMRYMFQNCEKLTADCSGWTVGETTVHDDFNKNAPNVKSPWDDPKTEVAFAVYSEEGDGVNSLTFYKDTEANIEKAKSDKTYNNKPANAVWDGIETTRYRVSEEGSILPGWHGEDEDEEYYSDKITSVKFEAKISPISTAFWFSDFEKLTSIDVSNLDTTNVEDMMGMFAGAELTELNLTSFKTPKVESMYGTFFGCEKLAKIDGLSNWDVSSVINMAQMFDQCPELTSIGDISKWDTSKVTNMTSMFENCQKLEADCSKWDVKKVTSYDDFSTDAKAVTEPNWVNQVATASVESNSSMGALATASVVANSSASVATENVDENKVVIGEENASEEATSVANVSEATDKTSSTSESDAILQEVNCLSVLSKENSREAESIKAVA